MIEQYPIALFPKPPVPAGSDVIAMLGPLALPEDAAEFFGVMLVMPMGSPTPAAKPPPPKQVDVPMGPLAFFDQRRDAWELDHFN